MIHGGAGRIDRDRTSPETDAAIRAALNRALDAGRDILSAGGPALDAVAAAVRVLEDDPHFNAGHGAALSREGIAELDAAIMDGATRRAGAVARVIETRSPVALARAVMSTARMSSSPASAPTPSRAKPASNRWTMAGSLPTNAARS